MLAVALLRTKQRQNGVRTRKRFTAQKMAPKVVVGQLIPPPFSDFYGGGGYQKKLVLMGLGLSNDVVVVKWVFMCGMTTQEREFLNAASEVAANVKN